MSKTKELQMQHWQDAIDTIFRHIDGPDSVLHSRAKAIQRAVGPLIDEWLACDVSHTRMIDEDFGVTRNVSGAPQKPFSVSGLA